MEEKMKERRAGRNTDEEMREHECMAWMCSIPGLFRPHHLKLLERFGHAADVYAAAETETEAMVKEGYAWAGQVRKFRKKHSAEEVSRRLAGQGIRFCYAGDEEFPEKLRQIPDPPLGLFIKGTFPDTTRPCVGIVGARLCTRHGKETAEAVARTVAASGGQVISGGAYGIDGAAQMEALRSGGSSFAFLGCGVDLVYPEEHRNLFEKMYSSGGVISEYHPGAFARPFLFPPRNRLISGLSDVIVIVEARKKSGSLITAAYAAEQGRDVYAVPGRPEDELSEGCNELISQGAGIFLSPERFAEDVLSAIGGRKREQTAQLLDSGERKVYGILGKTSVNIAEIAQRTGLNLSELGKILIDLELKGLIREASADSYLRI